ncbi:guanosine pentaphosphate phosphohydrolase [Streptomyces lydicamycinicus]|uniref:Guanosine pentaphosphate phosphohydrolase n=1 Tax=Streptomyces lydicamycinicus TaxID=1546107 RepID=A0A0P4RBJ5_9ACTN|nr:guanosine pentaphosphate phosphohydrolase [Streptomyces lydicamycinicus]
MSVTPASLPGVRGYSAAPFSTPWVRPAGVREYGCFRCVRTATAEVRARARRRMVCVPGPVPVLPLGPLTEG